MSVIFFSFYAFFLRHSSSLLPCICVPFFSSKQNITNITSSFPLHPDRHHHLLLSFMFQTPSSAPSLLVYFLPSSVKPASRHHHHQSLFCLVSLSCVAVSHRCCLSSTISFIFVQLVRSPSVTSSLFPCNRQTSTSQASQHHRPFVTLPAAVQLTGRVPPP